MPNSTQGFNVNAQGEVTPTGQGAKMSISGANNLPNQGQWHTSSQRVTIKLPSAVWVVTPNDGSAYAFTMPPNSNSQTFSLQSNAPLGTQIYEVETPPNPKGGNSTPSVIIEP
jgi:hypothetical protein